MAKRSSSQAELPPRIENEKTERIESNDCQESLDDKRNNLNKVVVLNVGGVKHQTTVGTISTISGTMLDRMFNGPIQPKPSADGSYFIDRDGRHFCDILNFLRDGKFTLSSNSRSAVEQLLYEAQFYQIQPLIKILQSMRWLNEIGSSVLHFSHMEPLRKLGFTEWNRLPLHFDSDNNDRSLSTRELLGYSDHCHHEIAFIMSVTDKVFGILIDTSTFRRSYSGVQWNGMNRDVNWKGMIFQTNKNSAEFFETRSCTIEKKESGNFGIQTASPIDLFALEPACNQFHVYFKMGRTQVTIQTKAHKLVACASIAEKYCIRRTTL